MPKPAKTLVRRVPSMSSQAFLSACQVLTIRPEDVILAPHITQYITETLALERDTAIEYLRLSDNPLAQKFLTLYDAPLITLSHRKVLPLEAYCLSGKINPLDLLEILVGVLVRVGAQQSAVIAAVHQPAIVAKTVEAALQPDNFRERQLFHKATGFLPTPKGSQTSIKVVQSQQQGQQQGQQQVAAAPPPEQTIRRLVDRFNTQAAMPAAAIPSQLPDRIPDDDTVPEVIPTSEEPMRVQANTPAPMYDGDDDECSTEAVEE
jgi:hypothetical protein